MTDDKWTTTDSSQELTKEVAMFFFVFFFPDPLIQIDSDLNY